MYDKDYETGLNYNLITGEKLDLKDLFTSEDDGKTVIRKTVYEELIKSWRSIEGDSINISYPNSVTKRGRVGREVSQTILTSPNIGIIKEIQENENTAGAIFISEDGKHPMKIRRLTTLL